MRRLIKYEILKIYSRGWMLLVLIFLLLVNVLFIRNKFYRNDSIAGIAKINEEFSGKMTVETIEKVKENYLRFYENVQTGTYSTDYRDDTYTGYEINDYLEFKAVFDEMKRRYQYSNDMNEMAEICKDNANFFADNECFAQSKLNRLLAARYSGRKIISYYNTNDCLGFLSYDFGGLLVIVYSLFSVLISIEKERVSGICQFTKSCKIENKKVMFSKLVAISANSILVLLLFEIVSIGSFDLLKYPGLFAEPAYSLTGYDMIAFNGTVLELMIMSFVMRTVGLTAIISIFFIITLCIANNYISLVANSLFIVMMIEGVKKTNFLVNPLTGFCFSEMKQRIMTVEIFKLPVFSEYISVMFSLVIIITSSVLIRRGYVKCED